MLNRLEVVGGGTVVDGGWACASKVDIGIASLGIKWHAWELRTSRETVKTGYGVLLEEGGTVRRQPHPDYKSDV